MTDPKERPQCLNSYSVSIETACGEMIVTVTYEANIEEPWEVFIKGTLESCNISHMEALGRMISLALRTGTSIDSVIKTLSGINCGHVRWVGKGQQILSCADAVAYVLRLGKGL